MDYRAARLLEQVGNIEQDRFHARVACADHIGELIVPDIHDLASLQTGLLGWRA